MLITCFSAQSSTRQAALLSGVTSRRLGHYCSVPGSCRVSPQAVSWVNQRQEGVFKLNSRSHDLVTHISPRMVSNDVPVLGTGEELRDDLDTLKLPRHIAIIMDGNRRWAKQRGLLSCLQGHEAGLDSLKRVAKKCQERGIQALTVFAFSSENWNRGKTEVDGLMALIESTFKSNVEDLVAEGVRFKFFGQLERLPLSVRKCVSRCLSSSICCIHSS